MKAVVTKSNKIIVCVRCPYDIMVSKMNFIPIHNHGGLINEDFQKDIPEKWGALVTECAKDIKEYHERVFKDLVPQVPVYFIRYEDMVLDPQTNLEKLFCFILGKESIKGLNIEKRIESIIQMGHGASVAYEQKAQKMGIKFNKNIDKFTAE